MAEDFDLKIRHWDGALSRVYAEAVESFEGARAGLVRILGVRIEQTKERSEEPGMDRGASVSDVVISSQDTKG